MARHQRSRAARGAALILPLTLAAAACGEDTGSGSGSSAVSVVASTNVYGDLAQQVAGENAEVTSIITGAAQDPHEYEATSRDQLAVTDADVVIENGGGYDTFMEGLMAQSDAAPVDAVELSGLLPEDEEHSDEEHSGEEHADEEHSGEEHSDEHSGEEHGHVEGFNEHVWYDYDAMDRMASALATELGEVDPDNAEAYQANYESLSEELDALQQSADELAGTAEGQSVAITEPVPVYLLEDVGLTNRTPAEFSEAVEEGADVPPRTLQETLDLVEGGEVALVAYNTQTADSTTERVKEAAEGADVPVVDFTETLPEGQGYLDWQRSNLDALSSALGS